jgi:hypothetical protein
LCETACKCNKFAAFIRKYVLTAFEGVCGDQACRRNVTFLLPEVLKFRLKMLEECFTTFLVVESLRIVSPKTYC